MVSQFELLGQEEIHWYLPALCHCFTACSFDYRNLWHNILQPAFHGLSVWIASSVTRIYPNARYL